MILHFSNSVVGAIRGIKESVKAPTCPCGDVRVFLEELLLFADDVPGSNQDKVLSTSNHVFGSALWKRSARGAHGNQITAKLLGDTLDEL